MTFWKPGTIAPGSNVPAVRASHLERDDEKEGSIAVFNANAALSLQKQRMALPIYRNRTEILYLMDKYPVVIIVGETGCGKTTQIPQYLHEGGWTAKGKKVACTQPRRVAATSVAARVAEEMGTSVGGEVGYSIRFDDCVDEQRTRIKYMTDGMLLRETMMDPLLSQYSVIMVDEAHERSLYTDILLGLLKKVQRKRKDLRLVISSATIDAEDVRDFFNTNKSSDETQDNVFIMSIEGRTFPVDIHYSEAPVSDYLQATLQTVLEIHKTQPPGDILVFLTGQEEIDRTVTLIGERISEENKKMEARVLGLYAGLPHDQQMSVFSPPSAKVRKIVVATNIAETSVTIDGIVYVIDCGFVKIRAYNPRLGVETLVVTPTSQATAKQRAGRAGRNRPGKSYRLYTEEDYLKLPPAPVPEIQRTNLSMVVLQLKSLGIDDIFHFDFMSSPPVDNLIRALEILFSLGVLDDKAKLTSPVGKIIAEFPVEPFLAKMLISAGMQYNCSEEILTIAALLSVQSIFVTATEHKKAAEIAKRRWTVNEGDHLTMLNVFLGFLKHNKSSEWCSQRHFSYRSLMRAVQIRNQLERYMKRSKIPVVSCGKDHVAIRKAIVSGFFANAARLSPDGSYRTIRDNQILHISPNSVLHDKNPEWVVYHEVVQTTKIYMREITVIDPLWLNEIAPHFYDYKPRSQQLNDDAHEEEPTTKKPRMVF